MALHLRLCASEAAQKQQSLALNELFNALRALQEATEEAKVGPELNFVYFLSESMRGEFFWGGVEGPVGPGSIDSVRTSVT